jgi:PRC-barrel domain
MNTGYRTNADMGTVERTMGTVERTNADVRETPRLIASDKVEGTSVRNSAGDKVGTIERVMIDKRSGKVAYAVMSFGGFLGIGADYVALPWHVLRYNENLDAYEVNITENQLRGAPPPASSWETGTVSRDWERNLHNYYGVDPYW